MPHALCDPELICNQHSVICGCFNQFEVNHIMEAETLELSPSPASVELPTLNSLGSMPERGSCAAFPASLGL